MLLLLRKIRKALLSKNKLITYLLYAIGEIGDLFHKVEFDIRMKDLIYPKDGKSLDLIIGESIQPKSYDVLLQNEELEAYLSYSILFNNISQTQSVPLKDHINVILEQIQKSLELYQ